MVKNYITTTKAIAKAITKAITFVNVKLIGYAVHYL